MEDNLLKTHAADVALPASSGFFGTSCLVWLGGASGFLGGGWPGTVAFSRKLSAKRITVLIIFCIICITVGLLIHFQSPNTSQEATQTTIGTWTNSVTETTPSPITETTPSSMYTPVDPDDPGCVGTCTLECGWDTYSNSCRFYPDHPDATGSGCVGICRPDQHPGRTSFEWADSDGDGCVSERELAEYRSNYGHDDGAWTLTPFGSIDTTGDRCVSQDEWNAYFSECGHENRVHDRQWGCVYK